MIRKFLITGFMFIFISGIPLYSQNEILSNGSIDISSFENRFKAVDVSMNYLKNKNIDSNDLITLYSETESIFRELKYASELKDYDTTLKYLSFKLSVLEEKSLDRVSFSRRMSLIYFLLVGMGLIIIVTMSIYSVYMYSRRK